MDVCQLGGYKPQPGRQQNGDEEGENQKLGPFSAHLSSCLNGTQDGESTCWPRVLCSRFSGLGKGDWRMRMTRKRLHPAEF